MQLDLATADYIGARSQQQDTTAAKLLHNKAGALLVMADGLGGHESGAEASRIVVTTFEEASETGAFDLIEGRRSALRETLDRANTRIAGGVNPAHGQRSMASTAVAAIVADGALQWVSVGDSHLYIWREGRLYKLNQDHSQAGLMVRSGQYKATDPEVLAAKSVLVSALTGRKLEIVDHPKETFKVEKGDVLLLASDGLNTLPEQEIESIVTSVQSDGAQRLSARLLETVKNRRADRQDNTAVAVARVLDLPDQPTTAVVTELSEITHQITTPHDASETPAFDFSGPVTQRAGATSSDGSAAPFALHPDSMGRDYEPRAHYSRGRRSAIFMLSAIFIILALTLAGLAALYVFNRELLQPIEGTWTSLQRSLGIGGKLDTDATQQPAVAPPPDASGRAPPKASPAASPPPKPNATPPRVPPPGSTAPPSQAAQPVPAPPSPAQPTPVQPTPPQATSPPSTVPAAPQVLPPGQTNRNDPAQPFVPEQGGDLPVFQEQQRPATRSAAPPAPRGNIRP